MSACSISKTTQEYTNQPRNDSGVGLFISAAFGPDGRLWRLVPASDYVYVDYTTDYGVTFSHPVAVNNKAQRIKARAEDRPSIAIDNRGYVYVIYFADEVQPWTTYFSYSHDGGKHFSAPVRVSDHARKAKHYQDVMAITPSGRLYLFWNDERDQTDIPGA